MSSEPPQNATILVIDDEPSMIDMVDQLFQQFELGTVHGVTDPREAVAAFHSIRPDLVLLDLLMPHLDGIHVLEAIRASESSVRGRVPILVITADLRTESRHSALRLAATDFLPKPFDA